MELLARIRALLRRASALDKQEEYRIGNLFLSVSKHIVSVDGAETALTLKEFELLALLMKQQGHVFTRDRYSAPKISTRHDIQTRIATEKIPLKILFFILYLSNFITQPPYDRPEVKEAEKSGYGEAVRYSKTLAEKTMYCL